MNQQQISSFIWSVADILRGDYKQADYGKVILPFTVLRRLDCVLEPTKQAVFEEFAAKTALGINPGPFLLRKAGQSFYNTSKLDLPKLIGDQDHIAQNLFAYLQAFSAEVRDIFERFEFAVQVDRLATRARTRLTFWTSPTTPRRSSRPSRPTTRRRSWRTSPIRT